jgi:hypothetical protein
VELRRWHVIIAPMHICCLTADRLTQMPDGTVELWRGNQRIGYFKEYMGWFEQFVEEVKPEKATVLSLVPSGSQSDPPLPSPPSKEGA